jgi:hypothetical protein
MEKPDEEQGLRPPQPSSNGIAAQDVPVGSEPVGCTWACFIDEFL